MRDTVPKWIEMGRPTWMEAAIKFQTEEAGCDHLTYPRGLY